MVNRQYSLFQAAVVAIFYIQDLRCGIWFAEFISAIHKNECVTGCTTGVEMVHCHPLSFPVTASLPPSLPLYPCSLLPCPAGLLLIQTWPWSAECVRVWIHDVIANCSGLSGC